MPVCPAQAGRHFPFLRREYGINELLPQPPIGLGNVLLGLYDFPQRWALHHALPPCRVGAEFLHGKSAARAPSVENRNVVDLGPLGTVDDDQIAGRRFESHRLERTVLLGVVPTLGLFEAGKLQHDETLRLPVTLKHFELAAPDDKAAAVLCDRGRDLLAVLL